MLNWRTKLQKSIIAWGENDDRSTQKAINQPHAFYAISIIHKELFKSHQLALSDN